SRLWIQLGRRLRDAEMAHADLQHGNILLVPGNRARSLALKLVDYDGMYIPALAELPTEEVGHPAYHHPQRLHERRYGIDLDRFSLVVIYGAMQALVAGGQDLWDRYDDGDNLLFSQQDFHNPGDSNLFRDLMRIDDPLVQRMAQSLQRAALE